MRTVESNIKELRNEKILVVGAGRSGIAAVRTLHDIGANVAIQDAVERSRIELNFAKYVENEDIDSYFGSEPEDMSAFDMLVLSPGVATDLPFIKYARDNGVEVIGELELAYRLTKGTYVAITGTNGKTTTTTLVGEIFRKAGLDTTIVGNIGKAAISAAEGSNDKEWLITEASSFQLESTVRFKPRISAILNLTPDHLNRHHTMKAYGEAKARIFANQGEGDFLIINYDDKDCLALADKCKVTKIPFSRLETLKLGAFLSENRIVIRDPDGKLHYICEKSELKIPGDHNVENVLAASAISFFAGISPCDIRTAVKSFKGVEHRIEYCGDVDGVRYYNDSKGTNVDATLVALKAIGDNIILIAGGDGKGQDFSAVADNLKGHVKAVVLLGKDARAIADCADRVGFTNYFFEKDMCGCVRRSQNIAEKGDSVLLSPACASWDMYDNYEQRGRHFKDCVNMLIK